MKNVIGEEVRKALSKQIRVYLAGDLQQQEDFNFIKTGGNVLYNQSNARN